MKSIYVLIHFVCLSILAGCTPKEKQNINLNIERGRLTLDSLYSNYSAPNTNLLRENYPFDNSYKATYLASEEQKSIPNQYSFLWPFSGTFSAVNALFEATGDVKYKTMLDTRVLPGLEEYFDDKRMPPAYASYISSAPQSDRFYDDNVWLGIDFTDTYMMTNEAKYLDKAKLIWTFVASGIDDKLNGGIYWCEQKKESKNTCSNAPGAVFALKLFEATKDSSYFYQGKGLYEWTKNNLQDLSDHLYFDNISLSGRVDKTKYAYNSGQMLQSAALLYKLTKDEKYLTEARLIAKSCYDYFFFDFKDSQGNKFRLLKKGNIWFTAVMFRGFVELYHIDKNAIYIDAFERSLDYAWTHARSENGLFSTDWSGQVQDKTKWLLTQAAIVEMYGRIASVSK